MADHMKLVEVLKGHKVYIQTHNFPDPDAIASAYGLKVFLHAFEIEADICYEKLNEEAAQIASCSFQMQPEPAGC